ncbi:alpha-ketoglutarate-dependent dioxygenase AlkB [Candidatus Nomurabacteria bacterium]|nr:alpha-ketoglutarate-dependent dioxygenase AlkB [Candidatus Nomurabacteria bacterium]
MRHGDQLKLFDSRAALPHGLIYRPDFISIDEEEIILAYIENLGMPYLQYREHWSKRRGMSFEYTLPTFLLPMQRRIAKWLDVSRHSINEAFIQEYPPGGGIGWHRDRETPLVVGVSLKGWARMRFRPLNKIGDAQAVESFEVEPRSAYVMRGEVATAWQHSVAPVETLRYSITFRTL